MKTFDVTGLRAEIVKPGTDLTAWAARHKPFAVCNASLYDFGTRVPIGTIIEGGKLVHNDGNGFGCGVAQGKTALDFGGPWDGHVWTDYLTGYNSPVQGGQYAVPTFSDPGVFDNRRPRIGVGRRQGKTFIVTDDGVTLREFAMHAIAQGFDTLVNLDGGGSRHLWYDGKAVYTSPRVPYNAIAFYDGEEKPEPIKPKCPYPEPTRNLLIGCKGDDVRWLQWQLSRHGYSCAVDGVFGWGTWRSLWAYQQTWSRVPDGICGVNTRGELLK